jgi:uncharacterized protein (TIGR03790 family)
MFYPTPGTRSSSPSPARLPSEAARLIFPSVRAPLAALVAALTLAAAALPARAEEPGPLRPEEVLAVARATSLDAKKLLDHYIERRGLPPGNVIGLHLRDGESIERTDFETWVLAPLRRELQRPERRSIRCLLVLQGLPLNVYTAAPAGVALDRQAEVRRAWTAAAFDSELALALSPPGLLEGWVPNPLLPGAKPRASGRALMVARLDGPTPESALALIDRAVEGERLGLDGEFCFDARGLQGDRDYAAHDERIRIAYRLAVQHGLPARLEDTPALFAPGSCTRTAFYVGWYSLGTYKDAFDFVPGAIGWHVASSECESLRRGNGWVKGLVADGITATLGPTAEPYLEAFPDPVAFLELVLGGEKTLAEIYWQTIPHASWRQVLIGDPLYRPRLRKR